MSKIHNVLHTKGGNGNTRLMFSFMEPYLSTGFSLLPVLIGLFALSKIFEDAAKHSKDQEFSADIDLASGPKFKFSVFNWTVNGLLSEQCKRGDDNCT